MKDEDESFSDAIMRIAAKKSLRNFIGALSKESAERLEKTIKENKKRQFKIDNERMKKIAEEISSIDTRKTRNYAHSLSHRHILHF